MPRRSAYLAILAAAVTALAFLAIRPAIGAPTTDTPGPGGPGAAATARIMALGDSITGSPGCWRALLWNRLQDAGFTDIDFVGTLPPQGCGVPYDGDNEGHGGALVTQVANQNQLPGWLAATSPDIVLMHFGTNDVWNNIPPATILAAYSTLVDQMRASNPTMKVLVAQIIPMNPSNCAECGQRVVALNNAIPGWAAGKSTAASPITVVDQWTGFSTSADTGDGVHPNNSGIQKISDRWFPALAAALNGVTPTTSPTPTASGSPPPTPPANAGCAAGYRITGQWQGGFQADVTVTNSGTSAISGWTVGFTFANGQQVSQSWNSTVTQTGATVAARNAAWNGALTPGAATAFGFIASWTGANAVPTPTCAAS